MFTFTVPRSVFIDLAAPEWNMMMIHEMRTENNSSNTT